MLFQSSIRKELARSFGATLVVLLTIVITIILIRTLGQASRGSVNPQDVMMVMGYSALGRLPIILTLSLFVAMVSTRLPNCSMTLDSSSALAAAIVGTSV